MNNILQFFPDNLRNDWKRCKLDSSIVSEIRIRVNRPVRVIREEELVLPITYGDRELDSIFRYLCHDSVYAYDEERRQGYMTVEGGHRIGITGEVERTKEGTYIVKYVRYMNIRIAHEIKDISKKVMQYICRENHILSTLIISPPGIGKTTLLRDMIRMSSDGFDSYKGCNVGVVDERGEIAGAYRGSAVLDCGKRTDIVTGADKSKGIDVLVRTFAPRVIAIDEIGKSEDAQAILHAGISGCSIIATVHGSSIKDVNYKGEMKKILELKIFERFIVLSMDEKGDRYFKIYDGEGNVLCGRNLLQAHVS